MSQKIESFLDRIPILRWIVKGLKRVKLPGYGDYSIYDLIETYVVGIVEGTFSFRASGIAYSFFMALFPFLLFILNLIPYIRIIDNFQQKFLDLLETVLPPQTQEFFLPVIEDIALNPRSELLSVTFALTMILAANGVYNIFSAFEYSYHVEINRGFFRQFFISLGVAIMLALLLLFTVGIEIFGEYLINRLKGDATAADELRWIGILQYFIFVVVIYVIVATLYYFGVRTGVKSSFFSVGALTTTLLILLTTYLFGVYINNFSRYNELYGSIGALLIMLLYIWINSNLLLLGFELNAVLRKLKRNLT
ncbi:YihY/virulence factor BrkB family protein [Aureitalea marina]|uniref:Ribonuclease BN n=1 Tax=Aureitalea marina TaxID=930804 RepID=A0A2S7KPQ5_9FLAO|nr:YihY/virulence factor BrkB family protein [Aureitalea marina]PQB04553.1 ribonuclease BN [Aureitalea marina]